MDPFLPDFYFIIEKKHSTRLVILSKVRSAMVYASRIAKKTKPDRQFKGAIYTEVSSCRIHAKANIQNSHIIRPGGLSGGGGGVSCPLSSVTRPLSPSCVCLHGLLARAACIWFSLQVFSAANRAGLITDAFNLAR